MLEPPKKDLEFGIIELKTGQGVTYETGDREVAFILLAGTADFTGGDFSFQRVGKRRSVFEGKAEAVYVPRHRTVRITGLFHVKIAVCATPVTEDSAPQYITENEVRMVRLGVKPWERDTTFIIDGKTNAKKLTIGEAYVTPGNWAGFPPHKHDVDKRTKNLRSRLPQGSPR